MSQNSFNVAAEREALLEKVIRHFSGNGKDQQIGTELLNGSLDAFEVGDFATCRENLDAFKTFVTSHPARSSFSECASGCPGQCSGWEGDHQGYAICYYSCLAGCRAGSM